MESPARHPLPERQGHKRSRSAAVLKSIVLPGSRTPSPTKLHSAAAPFNGRGVEAVAGDAERQGNPSSSCTPVPVLGEIKNNRYPFAHSPKKSKVGNKALENGSAYHGNPLNPRPNRFEDHAPPKDKENTTPPASAVAAAYTPIWAQFTSQSFENAQLEPLQRPKSCQIDQFRLHNDTGSKDFAIHNDEIGAPRTPNPRMSHHPANLQQPHQQRAPESPTRPQPASSKVKAAVAVWNSKSTKAREQPQDEGKDTDAAFEAVLAARNVPENMRQNMRTLDPHIKAEFVRNAQTGNSIAKEKEEPSKTSFFGRGRSRTKSSAAENEPAGGDGSDSPSKRSRSRSRTFTLSKGERSPAKRARSNSRPRSLMLLRNLSSSSLHSNHDGASETKDESTTNTKAEEVVDPLRRPDDFVKYLREETRPQQVEIGKLHKLRLLLRNETVSWVDTFILNDGMKELLLLLGRIRKMEWREEHEDLLLHEVLLCLKGLCTTQRALDRLSDVAPTLFPDLLSMLFDEERRGPSEFSTREIVMKILYTHLATASPEHIPQRARSILSYLSDRGPSEEEQPVGFILQMRQSRPYQNWCKEISNVTKEVFWIFLHHGNVVAIPSLEQTVPADTFTARHFPKARQPVAAAGYVGGVEWDATNYLAAHLDLMNGLIASMPNRRERNALRQELRVSGFEKVMGGSLRLCKEKFYSSVHDGLRTWVGASVEDEWAVGDVRMGPPKEEARSPSKSPKKDNKPPPKLELPNLNFAGNAKVDKEDDWI